VCVMLCTGFFLQRQQKAQAAIQKIQLKGEGNARTCACASQGHKIERSREGVFGDFVKNRYRFFMSTRRKNIEKYQLNIG
jgi:hypothetical protein